MALSVARSPCDSLASSLLRMTTRSQLNASLLVTHELLRKTFPSFVSCKTAAEYRQTFFQRVAHFNNDNAIGLFWVFYRPTSLMHWGIMEPLECLLECLFTMISRFRYDDDFRLYCKTCLFSFLRWEHFVFRYDGSYSYWLQGWSDYGLRCLVLSQWRRQIPGIHGNSAISGWQKHDCLRQMAGMHFSKVYKQYL